MSSCNIFLLLSVSLFFASLYTHSLNNLFFVIPLLFWIYFIILTWRIIILSDGSVKFKPSLFSSIMIPLFILILSPCFFNSEISVNRVLLFTLHISIISSKETLSLSDRASIIFCLRLYTVFLSAMIL